MPFRQLGIPENLDFNGSQKMTIEVKVFNSRFFQKTIEVKVFNGDFGLKTLFFNFFETWYLLIFFISLYFLKIVFLDCLKKKLEIYPALF